MQTKRELTGPSIPSEGYNKRAKLTPGSVSKVLHVRGLPPSATDVELTALVAPFTPVAKCLVLNEKKQGFIECTSVEGAQAVMAQFGMQGPLMHGKQLYLQYSSRTELSFTHQGGALPPSNGNVLIVSILNPQYPVTLDNLHEVFRAYGDVRKIVTFGKPGAPQALIQMGAAQSAQMAKDALNGKDIFQGCCTLRIDFSKKPLTDLNIIENNDKARDFTKPFAAGGYMGGMGYGQPVAASPYYQSPAQSPYGQPSPSQPSPLSPYGQPAPTPYGRPASYLPVAKGKTPMLEGSVVIMNGLPEGFVADHVFALCAQYGCVLRVKVLWNKRDTAMVQFQTPQDAQTAILKLNGVAISQDEKQLRVNASKHTEIKLPRQTGEQTEGQDTSALQDNSALLTKDYMGVSQRFQKQAMRDPNKMHPPGQVLHVSNLPEGATVQEVKELMSKEAASAELRVKFFANNRTMALVCMPSLPTAVLALIRLHNFKYKDKYIHVSFSNKLPEQVTDAE
eukprot:g8311.t1